MKKQIQHIKPKTQVIVSGLLLVLLLAGIIGGRQPLATHAAGNASFQLLPTSASYTVGSSFNLTVNEVDSQANEVQGVQADLSYNASDLQFNSVSESGSPFTYLGQSTGGGGSVAVGEASGSTVGSGQQLIAVINFTVVGTSAPNPTSVSITSGSDIQNSSETSVWDGTLTTASFTLSNPSSSSSGSSSGSGSSSSSSSGSGSSSSSSSSSGSGASSKASSGSSKSSSSSSSSSSGGSKPSTTTTTPSTPTTTAAPSAITYLSVTVTDAQGKKIAGAKVSLDNKTTTATNKNGAVVFSAVTSGTHTITVSDPGKKTTQTQISLSPGENKFISIKLASQSSSSNATTIALVAGIILLLIIIGGGYWYLMIFRNHSQNPSDSPTTTPSSSGEVPDSITKTTASAIVVSPGQPKVPTPAPSVPATPSGSGTTISPTESNNPTQPIKQDQP